MYSLRLAKLLVGSAQAIPNHSNGVANIPGGLKNVSHTGHIPAGVNLSSFTDLKNRFPWIWVSQMRLLISFLVYQHVFWY